MSSTNRNTTRNANDYYITPQDHIKLFWSNWLSNHKDFNTMDVQVLDPSAGGDEKYDMSYPTVLQPSIQDNIYTMDIREDSKALHIGNYLTSQLMWKPDLIITNPPFNLAMEFINKAIKDITDDGYVIMLLRLNFLGSLKRWGFLQHNMPTEIYVHSKRMSFDPTSSKTDSIEYAHFVWRKSNPEGCSKTYLIR